MPQSAAVSQVFGGEVPVDAVELDVEPPSPAAPPLLVPLVVEPPPPSLEVEVELALELELVLELELELPQAARAPTVVRVRSE